MQILKKYKLLFILIFFIGFSFSYLIYMNMPNPKIAPSLYDLRFEIITTNTNLITDFDNLTQKNCFFSCSQFYTLEKIMMKNYERELAKLAYNNSIYWSEDSYYSRRIVIEVSNCLDINQCKNEISVFFNQSNNKLKKELDLHFDKLNYLRDINDEEAPSSIEMSSKQILIDLETGEQKKIFNYDSNTSFVFSPDGKQVLVLLRKKVEKEEKPDFNLENNYYNIINELYESVKLDFISQNIKNYEIKYSKYREFFYNIPNEVKAFVFLFVFLFFSYYSMHIFDRIRKN